MFTQTTIEKFDFAYRKKITSTRSQTEMFTQTETLMFTQTTIENSDVVYRKKITSTRSQTEMFTQTETLMFTQTTIENSDFAYREGTVSCVDGMKDMKQNQNITQQFHK